MTVYFTSDLHLGHGFVAALRGFETAENHDEALALNWAATVRKKDDIVWVLGDVTLNRFSRRACWFEGLPGRKRLILGNHDRAHPMHRDAHNHLAEYLGVFEYVSTAGRARIAGQDVLLSHFPYDADRGDEVRGAQWRLPDFGQPLVHGHLHVPERHSQSALGTAQLHVGLDAWSLAPVSEIDLARLSTKPSYAREDDHA